MPNELKIKLNPQGERIDKPQPTKPAVEKSPEPPQPPEPPKPSGDDNSSSTNGGSVSPKPSKNYKPYIIGGAILIIALLCFALFKWIIPEGGEISDGGDSTNTKNNSIIVNPEPPIDHHLQQLIQNGEEVFKTKNIARAKRIFKDALLEYPDNQDILKRIKQCDEILRRSDYTALTGKRGSSPNGEDNNLGFEDADGYIVIDFLYDDLVSKQSEMIALKKDEKCGVVGGKLKDGVSEFKYTEVLWISGNGGYYRLINFTNNIFDSDDAKVKDGKLEINKHNDN